MVTMLSNLFRRIKTGSQTFLQSLKGATSSSSKLSKKEKDQQNFNDTESKSSENTESSQESSMENIMMIDIEAGILITVMCEHERLAMIKAVKDFHRSSESLMCTLISVNHGGDEVDDTFFFVEAFKRNGKIFLSKVKEKELDQFLDLFNAGAEVRYY